MTARIVDVTIKAAYAMPCHDTGSLLAPSQFLEQITEQLRKERRVGGGSFGAGAQSVVPVGEPEITLEVRK